MADRLTGLDVFVRAMRLGGLSAAARDLHISPAMATKHLDALEARLGTTLVHRTTRRLSLSEAGAAYLDKAERLLLDLAEADAEASARSVIAQGLLRVSAPATFGVLHLAPLVPNFCARHPGVTIEFGFNDRYVDLLEERWDVGVRIGRLTDSALVARRLAPMRGALCASPDYLSRRGTPTHLADLGTHECLGYTNASPAGASMWSFGVNGEVKVAIGSRIRADNGEALVRAAVWGQGLVYGPRFIAAEALAAGRLVEVPLDVPPMSLGAVHTITHPSRRPAAKTRAWIAYLAEQIPPIAAEW